MVTIRSERLPARDVTDGDPSAIALHEFHIGNDALDCGGAQALEFVMSLVELTVGMHDADPLHALAACDLRAAALVLPTLHEYLHSHTLTLLRRHARQRTLIRRTGAPGTVELEDRRPQNDREDQDHSSDQEKPPG